MGVDNNLSEKLDVNSSIKNRTAPIDIDNPYINETIEETNLKMDENATETKKSVTLLKSNINIEKLIENPQISDLKNIIENKEISISNKIKALSNYIKNHPDNVIDKYGRNNINFIYNGKLIEICSEGDKIDIVKHEKGKFVSRQSYEFYYKKNKELLHLYYLTDKGPQSEYNIQNYERVKSSLSTIIKIIERYDVDKSKNVSKANEDLLIKKTLEN